MTQPKLTAASDQQAALIRMTTNLALKHYRAAKDDDKDAAKWIAVDVLRGLLGDGFVETFRDEQRRASVVRLRWPKRDGSEGMLEHRYADVQLALFSNSVEIVLRDTIRHIMEVFFDAENH